MSEYGYVEQPILNWLCGESKGTYHVGGLGWTYRDEAAMAAFERPLEDPLVERLLTKAIVRINRHVRTETQAWLAVAALRKAMAQPDRLTANRTTLDLLRDGARVVLEPGQDAQTVQFIGFEPDRQHLNDFTATNQYRVQGRQTVPRRYGAAGERHPPRGRRVQELCGERQGLARGGAPASPLPAPGAADAGAQRVLRGRGRGGIPLRHGALP